MYAHTYTHMHTTCIQTTVYFGLQMMLCVYVETQVPSSEGMV